MFIDILIIAALAYGLAKLLNRVAFGQTPAAPWAAWGLTILVLLGSFAAIFFSQVIAHSSIAADFGVPKFGNPKPNFVLPPLIAWLFYSTLSRTSASGRSSEGAASSTEAAATPAVPTPAPPAPSRTKFPWPVVAVIGLVLGLGWAFSTRDRETHGPISQGAVKDSASAVSCVCFKRAEAREIKPWEIAWDDTTKLRQQISHCVCGAEHIEMSTVDDPRRILTPGTVVK